MHEFETINVMAESLRRAQSAHVPIPPMSGTVAVEVTLSRWLYNAVQSFEVLTIHPDYFRLRKPLARRLYEIGRKHCGHQAHWSISLALLQEKAGSKSTIREFRRALRAIQEDDSLPEYRFVLGSDDKVTFYTRDTQRLVRGISKRVRSC